jgi:hypothetical protein
MFKELFIIKLYKDEFTSFVLNEIRMRIDTKENKHCKDILKFYDILEEDLLNGVKNNEMTKFCNCLNEQLELLVWKSKNEEYSDNSCSYEESKCEYNCIHNQSLNNSNISINKNKKENIKDIDEWVQYIIKDEEDNNKSTKKPKKKNKNTQKNKINNINNISNTNDNKIDLEFEEFKKAITTIDTSTKIFNVNIIKSKPKFTKDWLDGIYNCVK